MQRPTDNAGTVDELFARPVRAKITRVGERPPISKTLRQLVYRRDEWTCQHCGRAPYPANPDRRSGALHLDHIVPWSAGGADTSTNLRTFCGPCNRERSNFVRDTDQPATPIVRICAPCLAAAHEKFVDLCFDPSRDRFTVYCGSRHHESYALVGWHVL